MTYIVGGKYKNKPFLMVDSIASEDKDGTTSKTFTVKLKKLESSIDTYFCLTGPQFFSMSLQMLDVYLLYKDTKSDFINNPKDIEKLKKAIQKIGLSRKNNKTETGVFFFINKEEVYCVFIELDAQNVAKVMPSSFKIPDEHFYIEPDMWGGYQKMDDIEIGLKEFCENAIINIAPKEDFKNRFSYIEFNGNDLKVEQSIQHFSDVLAMVFNTPYADIDNETYNL